MHIHFICCLHAAAVIDESARGFVRLFQRPPLLRLGMRRHLVMIFSHLPTSGREILSYSILSVWIEWPHPRRVHSRRISIGDECTLTAHGSFSPPISRLASSWLASCLAVCAVLFPHDRLRFIQNPYSHCRAAPHAHNSCHFPYP